MTYRICEANYKTLVERLDRLNGKLARIGAAPVTLKIIGQQDEPTPTDDNMLVRTLLVKVTGETPKQNGWSFMATLVHTAEGNIVRTVPGYEVPATYRSRPTYCDHCHTNRQRHDTYIVRHEDGRIMQVGSACLQDFIGAAPGRLTKAAEHLFNAYLLCYAAQNRGWLTGGGIPSEIYRIDLEVYLTFVATVVLKEGRYITRGQAVIQQVRDENRPKLLALKAQIEALQARRKKTPRWPETTPENVLKACAAYWAGTTESVNYRIHLWNAKGVWTSYPSGGYSCNVGFRPTPASYHLISLTLNKFNKPEQLKEFCFERNSGKRVTPAMMQAELDKL